MSRVTDAPVNTLIRQHMEGLNGSFPKREVAGKVLDDLSVEKIRDLAVEGLFGRKRART